MENRENLFVVKMICSTAKFLVSFCNGADMFWGSFLLFVFLFLIVFFLLQFF